MDGNDLVKGIEVDSGSSRAHFGPEIKPELYTLKIICPGLCMNIYNPQPYIQVERSDINYLVFVVYIINNDECPYANTLTYKLNCPYIFGDDAVHELVTYWKEGNKPTKSCICYRIELDGKESVEEIEYKRNQTSRATLKLGGR